MAEELAALRRRAYAPGGDIASDPVAAARLAELERMARSRPPRPPVPVAPTAPAAGQPGIPAATARPVASATAAPAAAVVRSESAPAPRRRALVGVAAAVAAALLIGAGFVSGLVSANPTATQHPTAVLALHAITADDSAMDQSRFFLDSWGIDPATLSLSDRYGSMRVWTGTNRDGLRCLVLIGQTTQYVQNDQTGTVVEDSPRGGACAPAGMDALTDMPGSAFEPDMGTSYTEDGSWVRVQVHGDSVLVWKSAGTPAPAHD
ncbi:hypothetical protein GCM10022240_13990 [Microbacterium kribbense]|uniref:RNA polymerase subunit sigma-70 n=1 Tax=Microbacterium kribbense TaxID=433645 RepID=A0ABP7GF91_9MICO